MSWRLQGVLDFSSATQCHLEHDGVSTLYGEIRQPVDIIANDASATIREDGVVRTVRLAEMNNVVRDFAAVSSFDHKPLAVKIGVSLNNVEVFANVDSNLSDAVRQRFIEKFIPFKMLPNDRRKVRKVVKMIIKTFFPEEEVKLFMRTHPLLVELKSSEMNSARFERALDDIMLSCGIMPDFKAMIKREIMPKGKKPRMIINAGDYHQIASLLVISCFEHFWYSHEALDHIKHADKLTSQQRIVKHIQDICSSDAEAAEGDGSSWDFCQSLFIRELIENPILKHIGKCLYTEQGYTEVQYRDAMNSLDFRRIKWWNIKMSTLDFKYGYKKKLKLKAVRPSGERGTSCLNHLVNCVLWACCLLDNPCELFCSRTRHAGESRTYTASRSLMTRERLWATDGLNSTGDTVRYLVETFGPEEARSRAEDRRQRHRVGYKGGYEGDDSLVATCRWLWEKYESDIRAYWHRAGFDMKIFRQSDPTKNGSVTFTGYEFLCENGLPTNIMFPTIPRNVMNSAFTVSTHACEEIVGKKPRHIRVAEIGAQALSARAASFYPCLPYLANFFYAQAEYWQEYLVKNSYERVDHIDINEYQLCKKFNLQHGDRVSIGEIIERAKDRYNPSDDHKYDELIKRTLGGYQVTIQDKIGLEILTELNPDHENLARSVLPPPFYGKTLQ